MTTILSNTPPWVYGLFVALLVIMAIFFAKYVHAVMQALKVGAITAPPFIAALSVVYGLLSGYFAARALNLVRIARAP